MTKAQLSGELAGLRRRVAELERREEEYRQAEELSKKSHAVVDFVNRIQGLYISGFDRQALFGEMLEGLVSLTESEFGYIGEVFFTEEGIPYQMSRAISNIAWDQVSRRFYEDNWVDGLRFESEGGLHGAILRTGQPVLSNDVANDPRRGGKLPGGHPPIRTFLGLPVRLGGQLVGSAGIANRPGGYNRGIIEALDPFIKTCGIVIKAYRSEEDRQRAEKELRGSEEKFRLLAERIEDVFWISTPGVGEMIYVSPAYERVWGRSRESLYEEPKSYLEAVHPDDLEEARAQATHHVRGSYNAEYRIIQPDGSIRRILDRGFPIRDEQGNLIRMCGLATDITEIRKNEEDLDRSREEIRSMVMQASRAEENERKRLARELHDRVGQTLTALGINLSFVRNQLSERTEEGILRRIDEAIGLTEQTSESIRDVMMELRPTVLDDYGLWAALRWHADQFSRRTGIPVDLRGDGDLARLSADQESGLFWVAGEALTNLAKHARASQATVGVEVTDDVLRVTVADDGRGFDPAGPASEEKRRGWGLLMMRERMLAVGGHLQVASAPGRGTRVCAYLRLNG